MTYKTGDAWEGEQPYADEWRKLEKAKKENEALIASYKNPVTGYGGFSYTPTSQGVLPKGLGAGYGQAASYILGGSQGAQEQLRQQYEAMLRSRTGGAGLAYGNTMQRGGNALAGQGLSPVLTQLLLGGQRSQLIGQMGAATGGAEADYHGALAELAKGTGTELAGLKQNEIGSSLNYLVGKQAIDASKPDAMTQLLGIATGAAGLKKLS